MLTEAPSIKPIQLKEYNCKQSKYEVAPKLPMRSMLVAPSGAGKTVLLSNMILDIYRDCFSRIYIWSPSVNVDSTWAPVKNIFAIILNQVIEKSAILIVMNQQNLKQSLKHSRK